MPILVDAVASILIEHARQTLPAIPNEYLWSYFEISGILFWAPTEGRNVVYLLLAPLFPLLISMFVTVALWFGIKESFASPMRRVPMITLVPAIQIGTWLAMILAPFGDSWGPRKMPSLAFFETRMTETLTSSENRP